MRDLTRARAEALRDRTAATCRLNALVLRHKLRSPGPAPGIRMKRKGEPMA